MGKLRIWDETKERWEEIRGAQGPPGPPGPEGERGDDGQALIIRNIVPSEAELPSSGNNIGDGALVGASPPFSLYVYTGTPPSWHSTGPITMGPQGEPGPPGPQPPLDGSGSATTAARSDHNHTGVYSPVSHTHTAAQIASGVIADARIPSLNASKITAGTLSISRIPDIPTSKITGTLPSSQVANLDAGKITTGTLADARIPSLSASKITSGTLADGRIPNLSASKISSGTLASARIPNLNASKITAGTLSVGRIPDLPMSKLFPNTHTSKEGSSAMRVAPGNQHAVIRILGAGWGLHDTGNRQETDEEWAYVYVPGLGLGWIPANRI